MSWQITAQFNAWKTLNLLSIEGNSIQKAPRFTCFCFFKCFTSSRWCMHKVKSQCIMGMGIKQRGLFPIPFSILIFTAQLAPQILIPGRFCSLAWSVISLAGSTLPCRMHKYAWLWSAPFYFRSVVQTTSVFSQGVPSRNEMMHQVCLLRVK